MESRSGGGRSYACAEASGGPGIESCSGPVAGGSPLDTSTPGWHSFAVTATRRGRATATVTNHYTVIGPPGMSITSPVDGGRSPVRRSVATSTRVRRARVVPGSSRVGLGRVERRRLEYLERGPTAYAVTAISTDGQSGTASIPTRSLARLGVSISLPVDGGTFAVGQSVATSFSCSEGTDGPGIGRVRTRPGQARQGYLIPSTVGTHTYTVTAISNDGQSGTASITYTVTAPQPATQPTPAQPTPAAPTTTSPPSVTPAPTVTPPVAISAVKLTEATVNWCKHCTYPNTRLHFNLSAGTEVRLTLMARRHGHWKQLAISTLTATKARTASGSPGAGTGNSSPAERFGSCFASTGTGPGRSSRPSRWSSTPHTAKILNHH